MSPPCLATIFQGDNGGATSRGVTATEIAVAIPASGFCLTGSQCQKVLATMFEFFNQRFELYGRRLVPRYVDGDHSTPVMSRALGAAIAAQQPFAALPAIAEWNTVAGALFQELGRQQVVTVMRGTNLSDRLLLDEMHPYLWAAQPSTEQWQRAMGSFLCSALTGRPARHAATPALQTATRKFGIVLSGAHTAPSAGLLLEQLQACGEVPLTFQALAAETTQLRTGIEAFKAAGVTTVVCSCSDFRAYYVLNQLAQTPGYAPEILVPQFNEASDEWWQNNANRGQLFGITVRPKLLPLQTQAWHRAIVSIDPTALTTAGYGEKGVAMLIYEQLLVLAAGIQAAGPALTPDTFAAGLMSTQFANTGAGAAPYWQPSVGFGPGDHSFIDDYAIEWWSESADALEPISSRPKGSWCYLDQGVRYRVGNFPADADGRLFDTNAACR